MQGVVMWQSGREPPGLRFSIDYLLHNKGKSEAAGTDSLPQPGHPTARPPEGDPSEEPRAQEADRLVKDGNSESDAEAERRNLCAHDEEENEVMRAELSCGSSSHEKPSHSYTALISMAILASKEKRLLLSDIYQWIMESYPYFKSKDRNWRNSVRHNLSLNDCFIKVGRSDNGKGHFWAVHPANLHDFSKGDYQRRRARRRARRAAPPLPYPLPCPPLPCLQGATCCCRLPAPPIPCWPGRFYWSWPRLLPRPTTLCPAMPALTHTQPWRHHT